MVEKTQGATSTWSRVVEILSVLGPPATVLGALLIYFGWARSDEQAKTMGLHVNLFGYTPQDFVLLSITALYMPLLCLLVGAILWVWLDRALRRRIESTSTRSTPARPVLLAGIIASATLILTLLLLPILLPGALGDYFPYFLALVALIVAWAVRIYGWTTSRHRQEDVPFESNTVKSVLVLAVVTLLLFWGTTNFAENRGRERAFALQKNLHQMPRAVLYSERPLNIGIDAVTQVDMGTEENPLYRYEGLRLLTVSGGRYFFLHDGWTVKDSRVVVLPDDGSVRIEYGH